MSQPVRQAFQALVEVRSMIEEVVGEWLPAIVRRFFGSEIGQGFADIGAERLVILVAPADADQGEIGGKVTAPPQAVQRGQDFARRKVPGDAEDDEGEGLGTTHGRDEGGSLPLRITGDFFGRHDVLSVGPSPVSSRRLRRVGV